MAVVKEGHSRFLAFVGIWVAAYVCCAAAIAFFYGLGHAETVIYPFKDRSEQGAAALQTAAAAMLSVSWAIWLGLSRKRSRGMMVLLTAFGVEASLIIYAVAGLEVTTRNWRSPLDLIFRSTFFAEYNWLTFILEIGPVMSGAVALFLFVALKVGDQESLVVQA
jgi:hypothetical protein